MARALPFRNSVHLRSRYVAHPWEILRAKAIVLNGSFFNTHRILEQYVVKAYF